MNNILRNVSRALEKRSSHNKSKRNHGIPVPGDFIQMHKYPAIFYISLYAESDDSQSDTKSSDGSYYIESDSESVKSDDSDDSEFWDESDWELESDWEMETETEAETETETETDNPPKKRMNFEQLCKSI